MIYFTADLHFYHDKIIRHTQRPYHSAEEMNQDLIRKWNRKVSLEDEVYILGDVTMKGADLAAACLYALQGKKHLIRGNHDKFVDSELFEPSLFVSIQDYKEMVTEKARLCSMGTSTITKTIIWNSVKTGSCGTMWAWMPTIWNQ